MGFGGFSWKRTTGLTRVNSKFSRKAGIPLTKSGRQRKIGKALTGGSCGCTLVIADTGIAISIFLLLVLAG